MRNFLWPAIAYGLIWAAALAYWVLIAGESYVEPLMALALFGLGFPIVTRVLTHGVDPFPTTSETSWLEPIALLFLFAAICAFGVFGPAFIVESLEATGHSSDLNNMLAVNAGRLAVFVLLPIIVMVFIIRHPISSFGWQSPFWRMLRPRHLLLLVGLGAIVIAIQIFGFGRGAFLESDVYSRDQLLIAMPLVFAWLVIQVGLIENFFFRGMLQSRLAVFLRNEWIAIFLASLLFAASGVPALLMGSETTDWPRIAAEATLMVSVMGITFGYIWMRTRNLLILMLVHALGDVLLYFEPIAHTFGLV